MSTTDAHLHWDHVGWNTRLENGRWVPTFPNARYIMARREFEHWQGVQQRGDETPHRLAFEDSVLPVVRAGLSVLVDDDYAFEDGRISSLWFESAPGHTPGNVLIHARSRDDRAVFLGDVLHHQLQLAKPEWSTLACTDRELSRKTRTRLVEEYAERVPPAARAFSGADRRPDHQARQRISLCLRGMMCLR